MLFGGNCLDNVVTLRNPVGTPEHVQQDVRLALHVIDFTVWAARVVHEGRRGLYEASVRRFRPAVCF